MLRILGQHVTKLICTIPNASVPQILYCHHSTSHFALRPKKRKSNREEPQYFSDARKVRTIGGRGGDGCISFLQLWCNERAGPDGGDGGNGGHVIFEASSEVRNYNHVTHVLHANEGEKGGNKDCHGKNAKHNMIKVPIGTIVRNQCGQIVADLNKEKCMFVGARGGCGGKGNHFFTTPIENGPKVCEYGAEGEDMTYFLELRSMADIGFIGFPNAGKSTLLRAISRAKPKVASYPFTTLRPHIGIVEYDDFEQVAIADLPGLIPDSHKNKGLGIQFLKHIERCTVLLFLIDVSCDEPWKHYESLTFELSQFSPKVLQRPKLIVANKIDLPSAEENANQLESRLQLPVTKISAKTGINVSKLLENIRQEYDKHKNKTQ